MKKLLNQHWKWPFTFYGVSSYFWQSFQICWDSYLGCWRLLHPWSIIMLAWDSDNSFALASLSRNIYVEFLQFSPDFDLNDIVKCLRNTFEALKNAGTLWSCPSLRSIKAWDGPALTAQPCRFKYFLVDPTTLSPTPSPRMPEDPFIKYFILLSRLPMPGL